MTADVWLDERVGRDAGLPISRRPCLHCAAIDRVMKHYVSRAFDLEAEADARAVLVSGGDPSALPAIEDCLSELETLLEELDAEFPAQG